MRQMSKIEFLENRIHDYLECIKHNAEINAIRSKYILVDQTLFVASVIIVAALLTYVLVLV
jgi:hypothetical protein